jgi:hypothetical protein
VRVLCNPAIQVCLKPLQIELSSFDTLPQSLRTPAIFPVSHPGNVGKTA